MGAFISISTKLQRADDMLFFRCPGCKQPHGIRIGQDNDPNWSWNGDADKPTFSPSVLVTFPANPNAMDEFKEWRTKRVCHSFVRDGRIQFLNDCTHALAGQTVDLPDYEIKAGE